MTIYTARRKFQDADQKFRSLYATDRAPKKVVEEEAAFQIIHAAIQLGEVERSLNTHYVLPRRSRKEFAKLS